MNADEVIASLAGVDTPTVCNALATLDASRKGQGYTLRTVIAANADAPPFTGHALTAKIVSSEPPADDREAQQARRFAYYRYLGAAAERPSVLVMQDCGTRPGFGCWWGEINVSIHRALGVRGAVVDAAIRDLDALPPGFGLIGGNVCPGAGYAHLVEFDTPVEVFGLRVEPGDLIHADRHGCVIIPPTLLAELPAAIDRVMQREQALLADLKAPGFDSEQLIAAWRRFEAARGH